VVFNRATPYDNYNTIKFYKMRTQLDDLKDDLEFYETSLKVLDLHGLNRKNSETYVKYDDRAMEIRSTINNIR